MFGLTRDIFDVDFSEYTCNNYQYSFGDNIKNGYDGNSYNLVLMEYADDCGHDIHQSKDHH
jgi:hypothetical protein